MNLNELLVLRPLIIITAAAVLIMLSVAIKRNHLITSIFTIIMLSAAFWSLFKINNNLPVLIDPLFIIDSFSVFYMGLIFASGIFLVILSHGYLSYYEIEKEEYYILLLMALLGASVLVISKHFISFFLGLEVLSIALFTLISYTKSDRTVEAGVKYLILAGASSSFLLFGFALLYAEFGTMEFMLLSQRISNFGTFTTLTLAGFALIITGVGFKLAIVPFHMWTPDVYEGAPAPVTALVATVSKGGMFAALFRFFSEVNGYQNEKILLVFTIIAVASMLFGNITALLQKNVKRILAYSSIAHLGYILVAFIAGGERGLEAVTFYLVAYFVTTIGAFGIIIYLSDQKGEADKIEDYKGLFWRKPVLATIFTAMLLSLAGIPLTAGFVGKFYVIAAGINSQLWFPAIALVLNSAIGLYYYLRIVTEMYSPANPAVDTGLLKTSYSLGGGIALAVLTILLIWFGTFPSGLIYIIETMIS